MVPARLSFQHNAAPVEDARPGRPSGPGAAGSAPRILIIDDDDDIRTIARMSLCAFAGAEVIEADCAASGLAAALRTAPRAILLDVMMPGVDGPATLAALRGNPATAGIPVIFLTAKAMPSEIERLRRLGACAVLTKPFDPIALGSAVRGLLETLEAGGERGAP
jgi:CheY-like chemotaxis protein